ncbi:hypothetical protein GCM10028804_21420 [Larkinella terrae]
MRIQKPTTNALNVRAHYSLINSKEKKSPTIGITHGSFTTFIKIRLNTDFPEKLAVGRIPLFDY